MLAEIVLVLQLLRGGLHLRVDPLTAIGHFGNLLEHGRVVDSLGGVLAPGKGAVVFAEATGPYGNCDPTINQNSYFIINLPIVSRKYVQWVRSCGSPVLPRRRRCSESRVRRCPS